MGGLPEVRPRVRGLLAHWGQPLRPTWTAACPCLAAASILFDLLCPFPRCVGEGREHGGLAMRRTLDRPRPVAGSTRGRRRGRGAAPAQPSHDHPTIPTGPSLSLV